MDGTKSGGGLYPRHTTKLSIDELRLLFGLATDTCKPTSHPIHTIPFSNTVLTEATTRGEQSDFGSSNTSYNTST